MRVLSDPIRWMFSLIVVIIAIGPATMLVEARENSEVTLQVFEAQGTPVQPTEADIIAVAANAGVSPDQIDPARVACWSYEHTVDHPQYWVLLGIYWCWNGAPAGGYDVSHWTRHDVKNYFTVFSSVNATSGPYYPGDGGTIARADLQWHFTSSGGGVQFNYYPWIEILGITNGTVIVTVHT